MTKRVEVETRLTELRAELAAAEKVASDETVDARTAAVARMESEELRERRIPKAEAEAKAAREVKARALAGDFVSTAHTNGGSPEEYERAHKKAWNLAQQLRAAIGEVAAILGKRKRGVIGCATLRTRWPDLPGPADLPTLTLTNYVGLVEDGQKEIGDLYASLRRAVRGLGDVAYGASDTPEERERARVESLRKFLGRHGASIPAEVKAILDLAPLPDPEPARVKEQSEGERAALAVMQRDLEGLDVERKFRQAVELERKKRQEQRQAAPTDETLDQKRERKKRAAQAVADAHHREEGFEVVEGE